MTSVRTAPARRALALVALVVAAAAITAPAQAQSGGDIRGVVTSAETHSPIPSVHVAVAKPARAALGNERGAYVVRNLPAGRYEVVYSALGRTAQRDTVTVTAGKSTTHDVALREGSLLLSSVIVSATRTPTEAKNVASTVNVLTAEHISTSAARESQDLLREIPGVELPRTSSLVGGTAQIVSIRGVDEGRTAVLFDGIPVNDAWGEWIDWGRVPKGMLDRVEVVEGGASSLYGANGGIGGIISFYSRPLAPGAMNVTVEGGSREARHGFISAGIPLVGALTANVSGDYQQGGGYTLLDPLKQGIVDVPSQVIQRNGYLRLNYAPSADWSAFATGHVFGDSRNLGTPLTFANRDQKNFDLGFDHGNVAGGSFAVRAWDGQQNEKQRSSAVRTNRVAEDSSLTALIPSHDWGANAQWTRGGVLGLETFSVGADYRKMSGNYDEVDFSTTCPGASCGALTRRVLSGGNQALSGAFIQAIAAPFTPLRVELTARMDSWQNNDGQSVDASGTTAYANKSVSAFDPKIGVRYQVLSSFSLHSALYKAFRAPNLAELYRKQISATSITLPNPDLAPETALGREIGFDFQPFEQIQVKGTYYVADYKDFNSPVQIAAGPPTVRERLNVQQARSEGIEAYVALRPIPELFISGSVNYDDDRVVSGPAGTVVGAHFNRVPSPKQVIRAMYTSALLGEYTVIWKHEGQTTTLQGVPLEPFTVVDATVRHELLSGLRGFVALENIGDKQYQINLSGTGASTLISYGMPRTLRIGMEAFRY
jgi:outer membrane receptor protein involved in Fe transport